MLLSRLYAFVEALGGHVEILARFEGKEIRVSQFVEFPKLREALAAPARFVPSTPSSVQRPRAKRR